MSVFEPRVRFVVVGLQRSGTTVTDQCLRGHPEIGCPAQEIYVDPLFTRGMATFGGGGQTYEVRRTGTRLLFDAIASVAATPETIGLGLKVAIGRVVRAIDFANALREYFPDVKVIHVHRDDLVAQYASLQRARKSGQWHANRGDQRREVGRVEFKQSEFDEYVNSCRRITAHLRSLRDSHEFLEFSYERDILQGGRFERLFSFVGVKSLTPEWVTMQKIAPPPEEYVADYAGWTDRLSRLPGITTAQLVEAARAREQELAKQDHPVFLTDRAVRRLRQGNADESARSDALAALQSERNINWTPHLCGRIYGVLEATPGSITDAHRNQLESGRSDSVNFHLARAEIRLERGFVDRALDDLEPMLSELEETPLPRQRWVFRMLLEALERSDDRNRVQSVSRVLEDRFQDSAALTAARHGTR